MAWLIKQRSKTQGIIDYKVSQARVLRSDIAALKKRLSNIDAVIRSHEVAVQPDVIQGRKTNQPRISRRGEMGRFLIGELKQAGAVPLSATDLAMRFLVYLGGEITTRGLKGVRKRVAWRMKDLASEGRVQARHRTDNRGKVVEGYWTLPGDDAGPI